MEIGKNRTLNDWSKHKNETRLRERNRRSGGKKGVNQSKISDNFFPNRNGSGKISQTPHANIGNAALSTRIKEKEENVLSTSKEEKGNIGKL